MWLVFFFSSRRRHTRCGRDWSSDVCSSDLARQARSLGIESALLGADGWDSPKLTEIGGAAVEGAYFSNHYSVDDPSPAVRAFVGDYRRAFGADPDSIAALSYDAARLIADAMRRAGSAEGKRVRDALAAT